MRKLKIDYSFAKMLVKSLGEYNFKKFLTSFDNVISQDKETEVFLKNMYTENN